MAESAGREHGTSRGYRQHRASGEETCAPCRAAWADYCAEHSRPRSGPRTPKPCGTEAAYRRHLRYGEDPCDSCTKAAVDAARMRKSP